MYLTTPETSRNIIKALNDNCLAHCRPRNQKLISVDRPVIVRILNMSATFSTVSENKMACDDLNDKFFTTSCDPNMGQLSKL